MIKSRTAVSAWNGSAFANLLSADAKLMRTPQDKRVAYNIQTAVDTDTHLIVHHDVVQDGDDRRQLTPMADATRQALNARTLTVLADTGYSNVEQQQHYEERGITCYIPPQRGINSQGNGQLYQVNDFRYDLGRYTYHCPAGRTLYLKQRHAPKKIGIYANPEACRTCPQRTQCTTGRYRRVSRHQYEAAFDISQQRLKADRIP